MGLTDSEPDSDGDDYGIVSKRPKLDNLVPKTKEERKYEKRLIVILENAPVETVKLHGRSFELLSSDKHQGYLRKNNIDLSEARPDILHQCLLLLQDSPLNRAGLLQVFIHTKKNILIQVHSSCRIPRTYHRFAGIMVQLLHKNAISAVIEDVKDKGELKRGGDIKLMKVIKNPVTQYLPAGCPKICTSLGGLGPLRSGQMVKKLAKPGQPFVCVVGALAKGSVEQDYCEELVSLSNYPLSAATTCAKVLEAFEEEWSVL
jgi:rRNA small subunit pseudouridine methyltransferase Nep1